MQHFVAEAVGILPKRSSPTNSHHRFTLGNIGVGETLVSLTSEHKISGIFERNAAASQIPKTPPNIHSIPRPHIIKHMHSPVVPFQINLLLSHSNLTFNIQHLTLS